MIFFVLAAPGAARLFICYYGRCTVLNSKFALGWISGLFRFVHCGESAPAAGSIYGRGVGEG